MSTDEEEEEEEDTDDNNDEETEDIGYNIKSKQHKTTTSRDGSDGSKQVWNEAVLHRQTAPTPSTSSKLYSKRNM